MKNGLILKSIALIGHGDWSSKLYNSLYSDYVVKIYSSREFLSAAQNRVFEEDLVWLTSKNSQQFQILEKILQLNNDARIILEKPYFIKNEQYRKLNDILQCQRDKIFLSQIWRFSPVWKAFLREFLREENFFEIRILRVGSKRRVDVPPPLDWGPHDLYLLFDLAYHTNQEITFDGSDIFSAGRVLKTNLRLGQENRVSMVSGYSQKHDCNWEVNFNSGKKILLDFGNNALFVESKLVLKVDALSDLYLEPARKMVEWALESSEEDSIGSMLQLNYEVFQKLQYWS